jgi:hypothetical protein
MAYVKINKAARRTLGRTPRAARAFSIRTVTERYVNWLDLPEQFYDLRSDPDEMQDLGRDAGSDASRAALRARLLEFLKQRTHRAAVSDAFVETRTDRHKEAGVFYGQW